MYLIYGDSYCDYDENPDYTWNFANGDLCWQNQLKKHLPTYMLPKQIKIFKKFPINKNYKVDRVSLKNEFYSNI